MKKKTAKQIVGILGLGEVGRAIKKVCQKHYRVFTKDLTHNNLKGKKVDILHICIPFLSWPKFSRPVVFQITTNSPKLVIIDSTVAPGTTRKIEKQSKTPTVHAPMMGVHPRLYDYFFVFPKVIGPVSEKGKRLALKHFKTLDLKTIIFKKAEETEAAKLFSTTYYGLAIGFCKWLKKYCDKKNLNFENVYTKFNRIYNKGYQKSLPYVRRPVLIPMPGKIGGHCVLENAKILKKKISDPFSKLILKLNETF